jgi:protein TonB
VYPAIAQAAKVQGIVELEATIDERGVVRNVKVVRSVPLLDQAAIAAVSTWRYTPTQLNGVAVPVVMTVRVAFSLN